MTTGKLRGLANCSIEIRQKVGSAGGNAPHKTRGLQSVSPERIIEISRMGVIARKGDKSL